MENKLDFGKISGWGNLALKDQYPNLFNLVHRKHATVHTVLNGDPLNVSFRRHLTGSKLRD